MNHATNPETKTIASPRILTLGVGSSGVQSVAQMCKKNPALDAVTVAIDTDKKVLAACKMKKIIHVGAAVTNGFSAGGDVELGRQSIEKDSTGVRNLLRQADLVVLVAGLGGGTGSGALPVITRIARETKTLVLCMVSLPFDFEGKPLMRKAEEALKKIRMHADAIVRIPNEMLVDRSDKDRPAEEIFARSQQIMHNAVESLWRMLSQSGVYGLDFACLQTMLHNCDGFCHFASAEAEGQDRGTAVASAVLSHRLLNKGKILSAASGVIVGLVGGTDLMLNEIETVMNQIYAKLPSDTWVNFGVLMEPEFAGKLSAMVLVAEQWKEPLVDAAGRQMGFSFVRRVPNEQGELPLETTGKGRFTHVDPTVHNHEDLDVPTYIRREIKLPR